MAIVNLCCEIWLIPYLINVTPSLLPFSLSDLRGFKELDDKLYLKG